MSTHQGDKSEKLLRCTQRVWHYHCQQLLWQTLIQVPSEFKVTGAMLMGNMLAYLCPTGRSKLLFSSQNTLGTETLIFFPSNPEKKMK